MKSPNASQAVEEFLASVSRAQMVPIILVRFGLVNQPPDESDNFGYSKILSKWGGDHIWDVSALCHPSLHLRIADSLPGCEIL